jgi:glycosyltransferase involved in cell wall biosynthesis
MRNGSKLRILHLSAGSDAGGVSRYLLDLNRALVARGHTVAIAGEHGAWHDRFADSPARWIDSPLKGNFFALRNAADRLTEFLRREPVDLLHVHYRRPALVARRIQKQLGVPVLFTLHLSHIPLHWPWKLFTDFGDHTHVASTEARQWLIDAAAVPPERITLIPHGIDPAKFPLADAAARLAARSSLGLDSDDTVAAYVGRLDTPKNQDWLLDLAAATRDSLPKLKLILAGDGPHRAAVQQRVIAQNLQDRVRLLGELADPLPVYHAADALLLPSEREGFSLVTAEAMSTGLPVLRTRTAGTAGLIVENVTGRSTAIDHDAFLAAATDFLSNPGALSQMGTQAAAHIREHFTSDRQIQDTIALYNQLTRTHPNANEPTRAQPC